MPLLYRRVLACWRYGSVHRHVGRNRDRSFEGAPSLGGARDRSFERQAEAGGGRVRAGALPCLGACDCRLEAWGCRLRAWGGRLEAWERHGVSDVGALPCLLQLLLEVLQTLVQLVDAVEQ